MLLRCSSVLEVNDAASRAAFEVKVTASKAAAFEVVSEDEAERIRCWEDDCCCCCLTSNLEEDDAAVAAVAAAMAVVEDEAKDVTLLVRCLQR